MEEEQAGQREEYLRKYQKKGNRQDRYELKEKDKRTRDEELKEKQANNRKNRKSEKRRETMLEKEREKKAIRPGRQALEKTIKNERQEERA